MISRTILHDVTKNEHELRVHKAKLTLNFIECIAVSLDHLKSKFFRPQLLLYLKEKSLPMVLRSHQYGSNI